LPIRKLSIVRVDQPIHWHLSIIPEKDTIMIKFWRHTRKSPFTSENTPVDSGITLAEKPTATKP